jgi:hypothetical protein
MFLDYTQRRSTVGRTSLDELITRPEESYRLWCVGVCDREKKRIGAPYIYDISNLRVHITDTSRFGSIAVSRRLCYAAFIQPVFST